MSCKCVSGMRVLDAGTKESTSWNRMEIFTESMCPWILNDLLFISCSAELLIACSCLKARSARSNFNLSCAHNSKSAKK